MAFPAAPTNAQLYTTADGRVYKYTLASDTWDYQSVQDIAALNNNAGATPPTAADDSTAGYAPSSLWVDVVAQKVYVNMSATPAAAVWNELTSNMTVAATAPLTPMLGSMYLNTTSGFVFVWNGTAWVDVTSAGVSVKNNFAGTVAPVAVNDSSVAQGYATGSVWIDTVADLYYVCVDDTIGVAVWSSGESFPVGGIIGWGGSVAAPPAKYLDATKGSLASQATYAELFAVIGQKFSPTISATLLSNIATSSALSMTWHDTGTKLLLAVANQFNGVTYNINSVIYEINPVTGAATLLSNIATNGAFSMTWHDTGTKLLLAVANYFNGVTRNINSVIYEISPTAAPAGQFYLPSAGDAGVNNAIIKYVK